MTAYVEGRIVVDCRSVEQLYLQGTEADKTWRPVKRRESVTCATLHLCGNILGLGRLRKPHAQSYSPLVRCSHSPHLVLSTVQDTARLLRSLSCYVPGQG